MDQMILCNGSMTAYIRNWTTCMVMYKCDSFDSESRNTITRVFHRTLLLFSLSLVIKFYSWLLKIVVLICEGILGLDVLGNPADT